MDIDQKMDAVIRHIVKTDIADLLSHELEVRFEPIKTQMSNFTRLNQESNDHISQQLQEDRQDINQIKIDMAKSLTQNKVIIDNQNTAEDKVVEAVEEATEKIPAQVKESVKETMKKKSFLENWKFR